MKLSKRQQEVIDYMGAGWALAVSSSVLGAGVWLQRDGVGRGGPTKKVNSATFSALHQRGLLYCQKDRFPTATYCLTAAGRAHVAEGEPSDSERSGE